jgi:hypothetical protein
MNKKLTRVAEYLLNEHSISIYFHRLVSIIYLSGFIKAPGLALVGREYVNVFLSSVDEVTSSR